VSANLVATFTGTATGYDSLAKKVGILSQYNQADGTYVFFSDSGKTYMFISGGQTAATDDTVIELVGVALPGTPTSVGTNSSTSYTGVIGLGA